jgi:hypothetical protein
VAEIHADIDALKALHEALVRYRYVQRDVADRGDHEIEATRASLEAKASKWRLRLEQALSDLSACEYRAAAAAEEGGWVDCSGFARAVAEAEDRLAHVQSWQHRVEEEAGAFRATANRFRYLLEADIPRTDDHLRGIITRLDAARRVQPPRP